MRRLVKAATQTLRHIFKAATQTLCSEMNRANKISSTFTGCLQNLSLLHCPEGPRGSPFGPPGHVSLGPNKEDVENHHEDFLF